MPAEARRNMLRGMIASHSPYFKKRSKEVDYTDDEMIKQGYKRNTDKDSDTNKWIDDYGKKISRASRMVNPVSDKYENRMNAFAKKNPKVAGKFAGKLAEKLMKKHPEWIKD